MLEGLLRSFNDMYGLPYVALRYFNVYGPRMDIHGKYTEVLIRWMDRIAAGRAAADPRRRQHDDGFRLHRRRCARQRAGAAVRRRATRSSTSPAASRRACNDLAAALLRVMGSNLAPEYGPERKVNPVPRRLADTAKAASMLGFQREVDLEEGLRAPGRLVAAANRHEQLQ